MASSFTPADSEGFCVLNRETYFEMIGPINLLGPQKKREEECKREYN